MVVGCWAMLLSCAPGTPSQYIQPSEMEDVLVDYHLVRALAQRDGTLPDECNYKQAVYMDALLKKYGLTQADFDSSLVYYYTRADRFNAIYERVAQRLDDEALSMGVSEGEIGKYMSLNADGDTANIWADRNTMALMPTVPFNRWDFSIEADSTYRRGDALMMQFISDYMYQTGSKNGLVYIAVVYPDTIVGRSLHFSVSGHSQMRIPEDTTRVIKRIQGFFYLGPGSSEPSTTVRLLFLKNVQLIRFHTLKDEDIKTDSIPRSGAGGRLPADSLGGRDSRWRSGEPLPADTRVAADRVAPRTDTIKAR